MRLGSFVAKEHARPRPAEENVCGVLVHARPERMDAVAEALEALPGTQVHLKGADGKLVVTVEDAEGEWAGSILTRFNEVPGVLSVALVYHHFESDLEGEIVP